MARFNSSLLGRVTKSVGNVTMYYMRKQNIARAKIFTRKDNPTPEVLTQRAKMKALIDLSRRLLPVVRKGFVGIGNGTTSNAFVSLNKKSVTVDESYVVTIDFETLRVASGMLYPPKVKVTYDTENKQYTFVQEKQETDEGYAFVNDLVYAVMYETGLKRARIVMLKNRGENGSTILGLPEEWDNANVKAYCFATMKNGKGASDSVSLTIA